MITINFYKDGAYIVGHDAVEICGVVSYAMWACTNDCCEEDSDIYYYQSINDKNWSTLGLSYLKINTNIEGHVKVYNRFKTNISYWVNIVYPNKVKIIENDSEIEWEIALKDAKKEWENEEVGTKS